MRKRREVTIPRMRFLRFEVEGGMNLANKLRTDFLLKQMNSLVENQSQSILGLSHIPRIM